MRVSWVEEALQEFRRLDEQQQSVVRRFVDTLAEDGIDMDEVGPLVDGETDLNLFRLKMVDGDSGLNHRAAFDVHDGMFVIYRLSSREGFYSSEELHELESREA